MPPEFRGHCRYGPHHWRRTWAERVVSAVSGDLIPADHACPVPSTASASPSPARRFPAQWPGAEKTWRRARGAAFDYTAAIWRPVCRRRGTLGAVATRNLVEELRRRHVYRVAAAYAVVGWLLIQVVTQVFSVFHLPDWTEQAIVLLILVGFPIALVLAWAFDATPAGIVKTAAAEGAAGFMPARRSRRAGVAIGLIGIVLAAVAGFAWWHLHASRGFPSPASSAFAVVAGSPDGAQLNPGNNPPRVPPTSRLHPGYAATLPRNRFPPSRSPCCRSRTSAPTRATPTSPMACRI